MFNDLFDMLDEASDPDYAERYQALIWGVECELLVSVRIVKNESMQLEVSMEWDGQEEHATVSRVKSFYEPAWPFADWDTRDSYWKCLTECANKMLAHNDEANDEDEPFFIAVRQAAIDAEKSSIDAEIKAARSNGEGARRL